MSDRVTSTPESEAVSPPADLATPVEAPFDPPIDPPIDRPIDPPLDAPLPERRPTLPLPAESDPAAGDPGASEAERPAAGQSRESKPTIKEGKDGAGPRPAPLTADPRTEPRLDEIWKGELIAGKYRVEEVIGKGGMGVVLRARHLALDEPVAIKVLRPAMLEMPGMVTRFTREARAASKIKSPHVARVTDVDTLPSGVPYMVLEYLEGGDLLAALRSRSEPFPIDEAARTLIDACDAIGEAHELGIVHRDLKPGNLFLARKRDGKTVVKVLDFGISKVESAADADTTKTGQLMGSPKYMSPEQMASMRDVDGRADIWALGAILYELCTGRPPFLAETMPLVCALVLNSEPAPPRSLRPDLPDELEAVILRCLQKDPAKRFATVAELSRALAPFAAPSPLGESTLPPRSRPAMAAAPARTAEHTPTATPAGTVSGWDGPSLAAPPSTRRTPWPIAIGALALALALGAAFLLLGQKPASTSVSQAATSGTSVPSVPSVPGEPLPSRPAPPPVASATAPPTPAIPVSALPSLPSEPRKTPAPARKPPPPVDPFGGSRK